MAQVNSLPGVNELVKVASNKLGSGLFFLFSAAIIMVLVIGGLNWLIYAIGIAELLSSSENLLFSGSIIIAILLLFGLVVCALLFILVRALDISPQMAHIDLQHTAYLQNAFGSRVVSSEGIFIAGLSDQRSGEVRARNILRALSEFAKSVIVENFRDTNLEHARLRTNVFTTDDGVWLKIDQNLRHNFKQDDPDSAIKILNGFLSTGTCYLLSRPIFSIIDPGVWSHAPSDFVEGGNLQNQYANLPPLLRCMLGDQNAVRQDEILKAMKGFPLRWILSMPIPYQTSPYRVTAGVLNIDLVCDKDLIEPDSLLARLPIKDLLLAASFTSALLGSINLYSEFLGRKFFQSVVEISGTPNIGPEVLKERYAVDPADYEPAQFVEPPKQFITYLSRVPGMTFLEKVEGHALSEFVSKQYSRSAAF